MSSFYRIRDLNGWLTIRHRLQKTEIHISIWFYLMFCTEKEICSTFLCSKDLQYGALCLQKKFFAPDPAILVQGSDTVSECRISECRISECRISECRITQCQIIQCRKSANVESANAKNHPMLNHPMPNFQCRN